MVGVGGLRHLALQDAQAAGFTAIALSRSPDKEQIKVALEDINWAREILNDKDKRIRSLSADEMVRDGTGLADIGAEGGMSGNLSMKGSGDACMDHANSTPAS